MIYNYKIKASIREDCPDYERLSAHLEKILGSSELVPLGNNEYGTNDWAESMSWCMVLSKADWFWNNAKELIWYNGDEGESDDPDSGDFYNEEDVIEITTEFRKKHPGKRK